MQLPRATQQTLMIIKASPDRWLTFYLCLDCGSLIDSKTDRCGLCNSDRVLPVSQAIEQY